MNNKIYKSDKDKILSGVCGGLAANLGIDSTIIRIALVAIGLVLPHILFIYIAAAIIIPKRDDISIENNRVDGASDEIISTSIDKQEDGAGNSKEKSRILIGGVLLVIGTVMLSKHLIPWYYNKYFWPVLLILAGAYIIYRGKGEKK